VAHLHINAADLLADMNVALPCSVSWSWRRGQDRVAGAEQLFVHGLPDGQLRLGERYGRRCGSHEGGGVDAAFLTPTDRTAAGTCPCWHV